MRNSRRLACAICGLDTAEAVDYVEMSLTTDYSDGFQVLGSHAACLNGVLDHGTVEVHLFRRTDDTAV